MSLHALTWLIDNLQTLPPSTFKVAFHVSYMAHEDGSVILDPETMAPCLAMSENAIARELATLAAHGLLEAGSRPGAYRLNLGACPDRAPAASAELDPFSNDDLALIAASIPIAMQAMDAPGLRTVLSLLHERVNAGWNPADIKRLLDTALPERVVRMSGLVASRLQRLVDVHAAPSAAVAAAQRQRDKALAERDAAANARAEALAPSLLHMRIHDLIEKEMPTVAPGRRAVLELDLQQALADAWRRRNRGAKRPSEADLLTMLETSGLQLLLECRSRKEEA